MIKTSPVICCFFNRESNINRLGCWPYRGSSINDVTALGGRGYQGFWDNINNLLILKRMTGVSKNIQSCVTSLMDDPYAEFYFLSYLMAFMDNEEKLYISRIPNLVNNAGCIKANKGLNQTGNHFQLLFELNYCFD